MIHTELVATVLSIHSAVLMASLAAFYKFGDRSVSHANSEQEARYRLRRDIAEDLRNCLRPVFEDSDVIESPSILNIDGDPWDAKKVNPAGGEEYRNALGSFLDSDGDALADYRSMRSASIRLGYVTSLRSWTTLFAAAWQLTSLCVIGLIEKLMSVEIPDSLLISSLFPTGFALFLFFFFCGAAMWLHDTLHNLMKQHD